MTIIYPYLPTGCEIKLVPEADQFMAEAKKVRFQSATEFLSKKTIEENYSIYKNYLNTNKWVLKDSFYQPTMAVISAEKGNLSLFISINKDSTTGQALVGIRITY
jgi:hypothetical protein